MADDREAIIEDIAELLSSMPTNFLKALRFGLEKRLHPGPMLRIVADDEANSPGIG